MLYEFLEAVLFCHHLSWRR